jgi:hypothetical protein
MLPTPMSTISLQPAERPSAKRIFKIPQTPNNEYPKGIFANTLGFNLQKKLMDGLTGNHCPVLNT